MLKYCKFIVLAVLFVFIMLPILVFYVTIIISYEIVTLDMQCSMLRFSKVGKVAIPSHTTFQYLYKVLSK